MPYVTASDGVRLHYEEVGVGRSVVFLHEYAGDLRSWEPQLRYFARQYRCIAFNARGYPPSDVPSDGSSYSQERARDDVVAVMDELGVERAHIVGHSMGAYTALHVGITYPGRCLSLTVAGCGWGSDPAQRNDSAALAREIARMFREDGIASAAARYADFPMRATYKAKDPRGWSEFRDRMSDHSAEGHALTMLHVQMRRPTLWDMEGALRELCTPTLVIVGDEDAACIEGSIMLKRVVPTAGLMMVPRAGHTINSEEPDVFNRALLEFFSSVENERWMSHRGDSFRLESAG